jgi:hypothetical protein
VVGKRTTGKITGYEAVIVRSRTSYHPVVVFAFEDRAIQFTDRFATSTADWSKVPRNSDGTTNVLFDPNDLSTATIDRGLWNWLVPGTVFALGAFLLFSSFRTGLGAVRIRREIQVGSGE